MLAGIWKMLVDETRACDFVCRYGGDEFVVVAPEMKKEDAITRAEKWRVTHKQTQFKLNQEDIAATISIGLAVYPSDGKDADMLTCAADKALYRAKAAGRDCVRSF